MPAPITASSEAAIEPELRRALTEDLLRLMRAGICVIPLLFLLRSVVRDAYDRAPGLPAIFWGEVAVLALWQLLPTASHRFFWKRDRHSPWPQLLFLGFSSLSALGYVLFHLLAVPLLTPLELVIVLMAHAGLNACALVTLGPNLPTFFAHLWLDIGSLVFLVSWTAAFPHQSEILLMLVLYLVALTGVAIPFHLSLRAAHRLRLQVGEMALRDPLTGLRNRRFLREFAAMEEAQLRRSWRGGDGQFAGLLVVDVDFFKKINDTHGHEAGDQVLVELAERLATTARASDAVVRWGGEEFLVWGREVTLEGARRLGDRVLAAVRESPFRLSNGDSLEVTVSVGCALLPFAPEKPETFGWQRSLALADAALYAAKHAGRNRLVLASDLPAEAQALHTPPSSPRVEPGAPWPSAVGSSVREEPH